VPDVSQKVPVSRQIAAPPGCAHARETLPV